MPQRADSTSDTASEITMSLPIETPQVAAGMADGPDAFELDERRFAETEPIPDVRLHCLGPAQRTRGKQKAPRKQDIHIRLDADIIEHFKRDGRGWQTRMNDSLRKIVEVERASPGHEPQTYTFVPTSHVGGQPMIKPIYLDYAATTPADPVVVNQMGEFLGLTGTFGNPSSETHCFGREAHQAVEQAREQVASLLNADPDEVIWTSGATESDNLAIKGVVQRTTHDKPHIVTSAIEHKAVLDTCRYLEEQGYTVTYINPDTGGLITPVQVVDALRPETVLVSLMHVNNETGAVTDITTIGQILREKDILFHTDASQSAARLPIDVKQIQVDFVSLSGHKMYGPKGIGALYVRRGSRAKLAAQMHGGGHELGLRSGTMPTHQVVGMGTAARLVQDFLPSDSARIRTLSKRLLSDLLKVEQAHVNGDRRHCVDGIINVTFPCVDSESLMMMMPDIAISNGSACTSSSVEPSHVLTGMRLDEESVHSSIRASVGRFTTMDEVKTAGDTIARAVTELRRISPEWIAHPRR